MDYWLMQGIGVVTGILIGLAVLFVSNRRHDQRPDRRRRREVKRAA
jgi:hypothetical protein